MALLLIFWQEGMVRFGPDESPEAWAWVKEWTRTQDDDARCWELLAAARRDYVEPEDWRGLCVYLEKVRRGLRARRADALNYARPLRDEIDGGGDDWGEVS